jgi:hypothetical protein
MSTAQKIEHKLSNWHQYASEAYSADGKPNFLNQNGELVEGIYLNLPNDVYHSLNALSSTGLKTFVDSPARYYRDYLSGISRKRTLAQKRTLDAGTYGHELCLEPDGFYDRYFRDCVQSDFPDALITVDQIEGALIAAGLPAKEGKQEKLARLLRIDPKADQSGLKTVADIDNALVAVGASKTESKLDKAQRLSQSNPNVQVFDLLLEQNRLKHGQRVETVYPDTGDVTVRYGDKLPIDGVVWDDAHRIQATVRNHAEADMHLSYGLPEVAIIAKCPITGMMLKVKFDWLRFDDKAVDLKTTALSVKPEDFRRQLINLHYDIQQAFYCYVAYIAGINPPSFTFVAVEYGSADICQPYTLSHQRIVKANNTMYSALEDFKKCKKTDKWHGYIKEDCTIELI